MSDNVVAVLLTEMERVFDPLRRAAQSPYARSRLFADLGWDAAVVINGSVEQAITSVDTLIGVVTDLADGDLSDFGQLFDALTAVGGLVRALDQLGDAFKSGTLQALATPAVIKDLAEDLFSYIVCAYLMRYHPWAYLGSIGLTLIEPRATPRPAIALANGQIVRRPVDRYAIRFDNLPRIFADPVGHLKAFHFNGRLDAAGVKYFSDRVLAEVAKTLVLHGIDATYGFPTEVAAALGLDPADPFVERVLSLGLRFPPVELGDGGPSAAAVLALSTGLIGDDEGGPAVVLIPAGALDLTYVIDDWTISLALSGGTGGLAFGPNGVVMAPGSSGASGRIEIGVAKGGSSAANPAFLIGGNEGTRLEIGGIRFQAGINLDAAGARFDLEAGLDNAQIVVASGDGDGFLQHILPPDGFRVPFALGLGFESPDRLYFSGGAGLDIELPVDIDLFGVIKIPVIGLRVAIDLPASQPPTLHAAITGTVIIDIGPFFATVEGMGLAVDTTFPKGGGNIGPAQVVLNFEPPRGIGLRINAGPVTGGGYLFLDFKNEEYAGVLQVKAGPVGLTAVGLVTTRMPDGSAGFSMVLIISADFPPIQLGYGFTLNGAGGLLGVNRTVDVAALQDGVRRGALDSLLFPKDAVTNARRIITDVGLVFPPAESQFVIGPMIKLGWGSPRIISIAIGVVIEFPRFTISLLGLIEIGLPTIDAPVVLLRLGVAGVLDPGRGELSIDATLFGSFVAAFSISGDMAVRVRWKGETLFAIAAGGFHPRFEPPAGFPVLNRLAIALADSDNPRIRLETYLAITPATVQFGARLDLYAAADFGVVGRFEVAAGLGFDTLIRFSPLSLEVGVYGFATLRRNGAPFAGVDIAIRLTGPSPWRVVGKATIHFFGEHTLPVELTVGAAAPEPPPPAIDLAAAVRVALGDVASWEAMPPEDAPVRLRGVAAATGTLLAHPAATLVMRQSAAPLDRDLARAGTAPIGGERRIHIDDVLIGPDATAASFTLGETVTDQFAPSQFFELSDDQRLTGPQFEQLPSGAQVAGRGVVWGATATVTDEVEEIVVDGEQRTAVAVGAIAFVGAIVIDAVRQQRPLTGRGRGVLGVALKPERWAVASAIEATPAGMTASAQRFATWIDATKTADRSVGGTVMVVRAGEVGG